MDLIKLGTMRLLDSWFSGVPLAQTELDGANKMEGINCTESGDTVIHLVILSMKRSNPN